jgi:cytochrome c
MSLNLGSTPDFTAHFNLLVTNPFVNLTMTPPYAGGEFSTQETDMADTPKKTKTAKPRQASANKTETAEGAKPTKTTRKGIELVADVEKPKKAKAAAKPRKSAPKNENVVEISQPAAVSREMIAQVAYLNWVRRGHQHGSALEDWINAEQELMQRAS